MNAASRSRPFFSIVTAARDAQAALPGLLASLAAQTCQDFEILLQDGASRDRTLELAAASRLPGLRVASEADEGIYDAWNKALDRSSGTWLLFLGADDRLAEPDVLERAATALRGLPKETGFASGAVLLERADGSVYAYLPGNADDWKTRLHARSMPCPFPGLFVRGALARDCRFDPRLRLAGDFDFLCRTARLNKDKIILPFIVARMRDDGLSARPRNMFRLLRETEDCAACLPGAPRLGFPRRQARFAATLAQQALLMIWPGLGRRVHDFHRALRDLPPVWRGRAVRPGGPAQPPFSVRAVPVFLISHNRLTCLKRLVDWLERAGFENIHIVDNASEYPPLLEYLARSPHRVTRLSANLGHLAVWKCGRFDRLLHTEEYIVSDPDVLPCPDCPLDAAWVFHTLLQRHPEATKVGFSLRLDDIPDSFPQKRDVLAWEKKFWENRAPGEAAFRAAIDTTFALYRPGVFPEHPAWFEALRTDTPYTARHLGWYPDFDSEEERQYRARLDARFSNWGANDPESLKKENLRLRGQVAELQARLDLLSRPWGNRVALLARKSLLRARDILGRRR